MTEEWRVVADYPNYEVSCFGRVRRRCAGSATQIGRILKQRLLSTGYPGYALYRDNRMHTVCTHRLLAFAFIGDPPHTKAEVNHRNGIKTDNSLANLEWCSRQENAHHASATGLLAFGNRNAAYTQPARRPTGERNGQSKLSDADACSVHVLHRAGWRYREIAHHFGVGTTTIGALMTGQNWRHLACAAAAMREDSDATR